MKLRPIEDHVVVKVNRSTEEKMVGGRNLDRLGPFFKVTEWGC